MVRHIVSAFKRSMKPGRQACKWLVVREGHVGVERGWLRLAEWQGLLGLIQRECQCALGGAGVRDGCLEEVTCESHFEGQ
jgi:hypothetical protein